MNEDKKSYATPDLAVYGDVGTLTQTFGHTDPDSSMSDLSRMSCKPNKPGKNEHGKPGKSGGKR